MTISTSTPASNSVRYTSFTACCTNSVVSKGMSYTSPSGNDGLSRSITARTCAATSSAFAPGSWYTAMPAAGFASFWKKTS